MSRRAKSSSAAPLLLLTGLTLLTGCVSAPRSVGEFEPVTVTEKATGEAISLGTLFDERETVFDILRGDHAGETLTLTVTRDGDNATLTRTLKDGTVLNEQRVKIDGDSATEIEFKNNERNVIVQVKPKQTLWPVDGETQEMDIRLPKLDNPDSLKERGTAKAIMTIESIDRIATPSGPVEAVRVRIVFTSDLRAANAERITDRWYTKDGGLIAERWDETVTAFGLTVEQSARTIRRAE